LRWLGYHRAWSVLKVGLAAAPLAPLAAPFVGASLTYPTGTGARIATILTAVLVVTFLARALARSRREALAMLAFTVVAAGVAAHIVASRQNTFFRAELLYEASAGLLAMSAVSAGLRLARAGAPTATRVATFSAPREVSDTITRLSAWLIVGFWACVAIGLHYVAAGVLFLLAGTIAVTLLLRMAELARNPRPGATNS
jgi:hypothetical protein